MKKIFVLLLSGLLLSKIFAATSLINSQSVKAYRQALGCFENQEYGKALKFAEDANTYRKQESEYELKVLQNSLSAKKVQNAGSEIDKVIKVLDERGEKESIRIINYYTKLKGIDFFDNDIENIRSYIKKIEIFPEAYRLIGDIYKLEGEYKFAEDYYILVLDNADILDIPNQKYEILYILAQISKLEGDLPQMETRLLNILVDDNFYKDKALFNSMIGTIKQNKKGSLEKFFTLYRASSFYCLNAYNDLVQYYIDVGENEKALNLSALAVLTGFTKVYDILKTRNPEYEYENINLYFQELAFYPDVIEWGTNNLVWKSYYDLASISSDLGYTTFATELLKTLVQYCPDSYWQKTSVILLDTIN